MKINEFEAQRQPKGTMIAILFFEKINTIDRLLKTHRERPPKNELKMKWQIL